MNSFSVDIFKIRLQALVASHGSSSLGVDHFTIIHIQVVKVSFQIYVAQRVNSIKIVTGPHSVNAKSLLVL